MASPLSQAFDRIGGGPRVLAILVGLGAMAAVWGFAQWGMQPAWVPVVTGVPMERIGQATQRLDESGIVYKLERGGSVVSVAETDAPQARVVLAANGIGASAARPGFELFDQPSWGMTDFTQKVNYRRALEGELERTIGRMRGVDGAQVHLALQESSFLKADDRPSEASVVLEMGHAGVGEGSVVEGIQFLVASAVEGLAPENVMVLDDRGRLLSSPDGDGGIGLSNRQLQVQRQIEGYLQDKAEALVAQMVGAGSATVRVAASLNFDQIEQTTSGLNPDQQALVSEQKSEVVPGSPDQGASQTTSNTVYETAHTTETLSRGGARLERLTVAVVLGDKRVEGAGGAVSYEPRTATEIQRVEAVVRNAVGFAPDRGDEISVVSAPIEPVTVLPAERPASPGGGMLQTLLAFQRPIVALFGLGVALFLALRVLGSLNRMSVRAAPRAALATGSHEALRSPDQPEPMAAAAKAPALAPPQSAPSVQIADPAMTARVVKSWLKD